MLLILEWMKCLGDKWCGLFDVRLDSNHFNGLEGIYIIWYWKDRYLPITVRVGHGNIWERLLHHRQEPEVLALKEHNLLVTWAAVGESQRDGIERYLEDTLYPIIKGSLPKAFSIRVLLPWEGSSVLSKKI